MRFDIFTLFPEMFRGPLDESILKRARERGLIRVELHNPRDVTTDRHHIVDDYPYGGGAGMVMKPEPLFEAVERVQAQLRAELQAELRAELQAKLQAVPESGRHSEQSEGPVLLLSPQGRVFTQAIARELAREPHITLLCGHYEGVDERIRERLATDELSIGDYVLTGGELAAMVVVDAVARLVPGVLAPGSTEEESHTAGLLEYPHYTRPPEFRGWRVPDILLSGNHAAIAQWRRKEALRRTRERRPDLLAGARLSADDAKLLAEIAAETTEAELAREDPAPDKPEE